LTQWLKDSDPDIVCLQEIKTVDEVFPRLEIEALHPGELVGILLRFDRIAVRQVDEADTQDARIGQSKRRFEETRLFVQRIAGQAAVHF
ncbi:endonuclease/exonuclease/phosphatase family protein, partial [Rhizobium ruizarguesonis]